MSGSIQDAKAVANGEKTLDELAVENGVEYMANVIGSQLAKFGVKGV